MVLNERMSQGEHVLEFDLKNSKINCARHQIKHWFVLNNKIMNPLFFATSQLNSS